jgi:HSP20 family protein
VSEDSLKLDVERNVLAVHAERPGLSQDREMVAAERPRGVFSRQVFLGEALDADQIQASYRDGVLRLTIPSRRRPSRGASRSPARRRRPSTPDR